MDPTEFLGDPGRKKSPRGSGRARVVEFSCYDAQCAARARGGLGRYSGHFARLMLVKQSRGC